MGNDNATGNAGAATTEQFVTFEVGPGLFGIRLSEVQEIIRVPDLVGIPLSPASLQGVANLRGSVLPVTSLRTLFGMSAVDHDDATRVVVVNLEQGRVGFVVDRVARVIGADPTEIENASSLETMLSGDYVSGVVKRENVLVMLIDPGRLVRGPRKDQESNSGAQYNARYAPPPGVASDRAVSSGDELQLVSFEADGQEYALPIADVHEIVQVPHRVTEVPGTASHVAGVIMLRDQILPLVALRRMFGLPERAVDNQCRVVVVTLPGDAQQKIGLITDHVREVLRVSRSALDPVPAMLAAHSDNGTCAFDAICRLDGGRRIVSIVSVGQMFADADLRAALRSAAADHPNAGHEVMGETDSEAALGHADEQVVVFRLAGEEYGVPINAVQEIVRVPDELTHVPTAASFMEGVLNLRGTVLPVIDQRRRFQLAEVQRNDRQRIMVLMIRGTRTGFIVDQVSEVLKIPGSSIENAPLLSCQDDRLIRRIANLSEQRRIVLLVEPDSLLGTGESEALKRFAA